MSALECAMKLSKEEVFEQIKTSGLMEYGLEKELLSDRLSHAIEESKEEEKELGVVAALNNADTTGVLLEVLKADPKKVMEGISIAAYALGTEKKVLYLPEYAADLEAAVKEAAEQAGVEVIVGLVNVRAWKGCALLHIVTAANLADTFEGCFEDGVYVSVNGGELKKVSAETKVSELAGDAADAKGFFIGYEYYGPEAADMTLEEVHSENGVLRVLKTSDCVVSETEKNLTASRKQSCGKCVFCREGLLQLQYMQKEMTEGRGKADFLDLTKEIGEAMTYSTPCTMGQVSSKAALSAVEKFESEYTAHIKKKKCPAGVCFSEETIYIDPKLCQGCGDCMDVCPKDCIEGKAKYIHMIDEFDCDKCGKCIEACEEGAIIKTSGKVPKLPNRLTKVGRFKR